MVVKFKVGMTISAETVFSILARLLPIENLTVEEVLERPVVQTGRIPARSFAKLLPKKKRKPSMQLQLDAGINKIIMDMLADGEPHKAVELRPLLIAGGYSANSTSSRLQHLQKHGKIKQWGNGTWSKVE